MPSSPSFEDVEPTWAGSAGESHAGSRGLRPGLVVSGRYRIGTLIGAGGMGLVYEAEHQLLGLPVALKVLRPELIDRAGMVARFHNEARCTAKLRGEHVVRVLDQGRLETGLPFFVMERLQGLDLRVVLQRCGRLPVPVAVDYARQACLALAEAHAAGIIHRDVKPSNLFVTSHDAGKSRIKLLDFGIARDETFDADASEALGTETYASPEHVEAPEQVDARSDIWSLGVVAFEALTGSLPFVQGWFGKAELDVRALERQPGIPERLAAVICRCLAREKGDRPPSAEALARALAPFGVHPNEHFATLAIHRLPLRARGHYGRDGLVPSAGSRGPSRLLRSLRRAPSRSLQPLPVVGGLFHRP